jgi:hypothetical protein
VCIENSPPGGRRQRSEPRVQQRFDFEFAEWLRSRPVQTWRLMTVGGVCWLQGVARIAMDRSGQSGEEEEEVSGGNSPMGEGAWHCFAPVTFADLR